MTTYFPEPEVAPYPNLLAYRHQHLLTEIGAQRNPNGTWSSLWSCSQCPDIFLGGYVGPVPVGYCWRCNWINTLPLPVRKPRHPYAEDAKKQPVCAECGVPALWVEGTPENLRNREDADDD